MRVVLPPDKSNIGVFVCGLTKLFRGKYAAHRDSLAMSNTGRLYYVCTRCGRISNG